MRPSASLCLEKILFYSRNLVIGADSVFKMVGAVGLEPTTDRL